jgi:adenylosuccinate synthase
MKAHYQIISEEFGTVTLRRRRIAKSLRWWLRENGKTCNQRLIFS